MKKIFATMGETATEPPLGGQMPDDESASGGAVIAPRAEENTDIDSIRREVGYDFALPVFCEFRDSANRAEQSPAPTTVGRQKCVINEWSRTNRQIGCRGTANLTAPPSAI